MLLMLIPLFVFMTIGLVAFALFSPGPSQLAQRLRYYESAERRTREDELERPFSERVLWPIVVSVARLLTKASPQQINEQVSRELEKAGNPMRPATFLALRGAAAIGLPALFGVPLMLNRQQVSLVPVGIVVVMFLLGWKLPGLWLTFKVDDRKAAIQKTLPDALDLITVCMEAGLAFDASMAAEPMS